MKAPFFLILSFGIFLPAVAGFGWSFWPSSHPLWDEIETMGKDWECNHADSLTLNHTGSMLWSFLKVEDGCHVVYSSANTGQGWTKPINISNTHGTHCNIQSSLNASGLGVITWHTKHADHYQLEGAIYDGIWFKTAQISDKGESVTNSSLALSDSGDMTTIWTAVRNARTFVKASSLINGHWTQPVVLSNPEKTALCPKIVMDQEGNGLAVWQEWDRSHTTFCYAQLICGNWSRSQVISTHIHRVFPYEMAINAKGHILLAWIEDINGEKKILTREHGLDGWSQSELVYQAKSPLLSLALSGSRDWFLGWTEKTPHQWGIFQIATRKQHSWSPPQIVGDRVHCRGRPRIALDAEGFGIAAWEGYDSQGIHPIETAHYQSSSWKPKQGISQPGWICRLNHVLIHNHAALVSWCASGSAEAHPGKTCLRRQR